MLEIPNSQTWTSAARRSWEKSEMRVFQTGKGTKNIYACLQTPQVRSRCRNEALFNVASRFDPSSKYAVSWVWTIWSEEKAACSVPAALGFVMTHKECNGILGDKLDEQIISPWSTLETDTADALAL